jgi:hypothetical protein
MQTREDDEQGVASAQVEGTTGFRAGIRTFTLRPSIIEKCVTITSPNRRLPEVIVKLDYSRQEGKPLSPHPGLLLPE